MNLPVFKCVCVCLLGIMRSSVDAVVLSADVSRADLLICSICGFKSNLLWLAPWVFSVGCVCVCKQRITIFMWSVQSSVDGDGKHKKPICVLTVMTTYEVLELLFCLDALFLCASESQLQCLLCHTSLRHTPQTTTSPPCNLSLP